jgi:hypothetical protein
MDTEAPPYSLRLVTGSLRAQFMRIFGKQCGNIF